MILLFLVRKEKLNTKRGTIKNAILAHPSIMNVFRNLGMSCRILHFGVVPIGIGHRHNRQQYKVTYKNF